MFTLAVLLSSFRARADAYVTVTMDGFSPSSVTIPVGDVVWFVVGDSDGPYTVSSWDGAWPVQYLFEEDEGIGIEFNEAGDYRYYDAFNWNEGVVHVGGGGGNTNRPPTATITSPSSSLTFTAPADVTFSVDAADPDDGVLFVEFYVNDSLVASLLESPYSTSVTNLAAGSYVLKAIVYDWSGGSATRSVTITVEEPPPPAIKVSPPYISAGQFRLDLAGVTAGRRFALESTDLQIPVVWTRVRTNVAAAGKVSFTNGIGPGARFFRVQQLP